MNQKPPCPNPSADNGTAVRRTAVRLELLKRILAVPTRSLLEHRLVEVLLDHLRQRGAARTGEIATDEWNNIFIRKGGAGFLPCVAAHLDTVQPFRPVGIVEQNGILSGVDERGQRAGIGADDKAGIFVCLELLERFDTIAVALFGSEEIGCAGARNAPAAWFGDIGYVIEFDAPGRSLVSKSCGGVSLFADGGEFMNAAQPVLQQHGCTDWQRHPFTDVMALRQRFEFSCLNVSCGYHDWHHPTEYVVIDEVEAAIRLGADLIRALGCRRHPCLSDVLALPTPGSGMTDRRPT